MNSWPFWCWFYGTWEGRGGQTLSRPHFWKAHWREKKKQHTTERWQGERSSRHYAVLPSNLPALLRPSFLASFLPYFLLGRWHRPFFFFHFARSAAGSRTTVSSVPRGYCRDVTSSSLAAPLGLPAPSQSRWASGLVYSVGEWGGEPRRELSSVCPSPCPSRAHWVRTSKKSGVLKHGKKK